MKTANAVPGQPRSVPAAASNDAFPNARVERMTRLLRLYPAIDTAEQSDLLAFLTTGAQEEIVQVTQLQGLEPRFHAFRQAHPEAFPVGVRSWLPLILFVLVAALGVVWRLLH